MDRIASASAARAVRISTPTTLPIVPRAPKSTDGPATRLGKMRLVGNATGSVAPLAQSAEHSHGKAGVVGSIPTGGSQSRRRSSVGKSTRLIIVGSPVRVRPPLPASGDGRATEVLGCTRSRRRRRRARQGAIVAKNERRIKVTLECEVCKRRNYITTKNSRTTASASRCASTAASTSSTLCTERRGSRRPAAAPAWRRGISVDSLIGPPRDVRAALADG